MVDFSRLSSARAKPVRIAVLHEELLWNHPVNPQRLIDDLGHPEIHRDARQRVGVEKIVALLFLEKGERLEHRHAHGFVQIGIEAKRDVVRGVFRARRAQFFPFV